jgi:hypothetical protein
MPDSTPLFSIEVIVTSAMRFEEDAMDPIIDDDDPRAGVKFRQMNRPPLDCPIKTVLWQHYRQRNPNGLAIPPFGAEDHEHPEMADYCEHIATCVECNMR